MKSFESPAGPAARPGPRTSFFDLTRADLAGRLSPGFRATQLFQAVYQQGAEDFAGITSLPKRLRAELSETVSLDLPEAVRTFAASDGTRRHLLRLADEEQIETVFIPDGNRNTFCLSSQAGCALACRFCLTGQLGLLRGLEAGEIVAQVLMAQRAHLSPADRNHFNVVLMGMGEPLHNYENVLRALEILHDPEGLNMSMSRITLSTAGLVPQIERLAGERLVPNLAVSFTGATDEVRDRLMPINRTYPIAELVRALRRFPHGRHRHLTLEYVLLEGVTDSAEEARRLARIAREVGAKVNLIPLNESPELPFKRPARDVILRFQDELRRRGIDAFIRKSRGDEISAACGQLKRKWGDGPAQLDRKALQL